MAGNCGSCTACCRVYSIKELGKPAGTWCQHCAVGKGCKVYAERPKPCVEFTCAWLHSQTAEGKTISSFSPIVLRQVVSSDTAKEIGDALRGVVSDSGTAAAAAVPGFTIAGKTGTAQKVDPRGGYEQGKYVVSFAGYLPADHPEFVGLVVLDDAQTSKPELNYGGLVAGPIFSRLAEKAARYLDLEPHEEIRKAIPMQRVEKPPAEQVRKTAAAERVALTNASRH